MYTKIKTGIAVILLLSAVACNKENTTPAALVSQQASGKQEVPPISFHIGQAYHGGIIFYIDSTGQHGLIAAKTDQGVQNAWNNGRNIVTNATGTTLGTGLANTNKIVNAQGTTGTYAALLCFNYKSGMYKDWYLPSKKELDLMYQQKSALSITEGDYWSSSEVSQGKAWEQEFGGGFPFKDSKNFTLHVRAISSF